ncbi:MAG: hypothetical protein HY518_02870 [Candidatus Aenigmarchaeota archaeon]|nr:hypothetical protein [Candidatus Aenigmarchaeota archaeon]
MRSGISFKIVVITGFIILGIGGALMLYLFISFPFGFFRSPDWYYIGIVHTILAVSAIISMIKSNRPEGEKSLFVLIAVWLVVIGSLIYFLTSLIRHFKKKHETVQG